MQHLAVQVYLYSLFAQLTGGFSDAIIYAYYVLCIIFLHKDPNIKIGRPLKCLRNKDVLVY